MRRTKRRRRRAATTLLLTAAALLGSEPSAASSHAVPDVVVVDSRYLVDDPSVGDARYVVIIDVLANDRDDDGEPLEVSPGSPTSVEGGMVAHLGDGIFRFEAVRPLPATGAKFTYGLVGGNSAEVSLLPALASGEQPSTDPLEPVARDDLGFSSGVTAEGDGTIVVDVLANDSLADDLVLENGGDVWATAKGGLAEVDRTAGRPVIVFTPGDGFRPADPTGDSFTYRAINSDSGLEDEAVVTVAYEGKVIRDAFNSVTAGGDPVPDFTPLVGRRVPVGGTQPNGEDRRWQIPDSGTCEGTTRETALVHLDGTITTNTPTGCFVNSPAWVPFTSADFPTADFEVGASIDPGGASWVLLGFGRGGQLGQRELGVKLYGGSGKVELLGRDNVLIDSRLPGSWPAPGAYDFCTGGVELCQLGIGPNRTSTLNEVRLRYEHSDVPRLTVWINDTRVFDRVPWQDGSGNPPAPPPHLLIDNVGFHVAMHAAAAPPPGSVRIDEFVVRVGPRPNLPVAISSQPQPVTIPSGGTASFSVAGSGGEGSYKQLWWFRGGSSAPRSVEEEFGGFLTEGSRSPTFSIQHLPGRQIEGDYLAILMDDAGERVVSESASLTVDHPPTIHSLTVDGCAASPCNCPGPTCSFSVVATDAEGAIASYGWQFGDGAAGQGASPIHSYAGSGEHLVQVVVADSAGQTAQRAVTVRPDQPPRPEIAWPVVCSGATCDFDGSPSSDDEGPVASWDWTFGDGATGSGAEVQHTYAQGGAYTVTLTVTDVPLPAPGAAPQQRSQTVTVLVDLLPVAVIDVQCEGRTCTFDGTGSSDPEDGPVTSYAWDLGDGTSASADVFEHRYEAPGEYAVALRITDVRGQVGQATASLVADDPPTALLSFSCDSLECTFSAADSTDDDGIVEYRWDFGDGAGTTLSSPEPVLHEYAGEGDYPVTLTVTDTRGQQASTQAELRPDDDALFLLLILGDG